MKIFFYEEFPNEEGALEKLVLVSFKTTLILAANGYEDYMRHIDRAVKIKPDMNPDTDFHWWPTLEEGYYISPFTFTPHYCEEIRNLLDKNPTLKIHLDLEMPRNLGVILKGFIHPVQFFENKRNLIDLINDYDGRISTVEWAHHFKKIPKPIFEFFGLHIHHHNIGGITKMIYTSFARNPTEGDLLNLLRVIPKGENKTNKIRTLIEKELKYGITKYGNRLKAAYGPIETGILGNEPKLCPSELDEELSLARDEGLQEVGIFRLKGYTPPFAPVVERYVY